MYCIIIYNYLKNDNVELTHLLIILVLKQPFSLVTLGCMFNLFIVFLCDTDLFCLYHMICVH